MHKKEEKMAIFIGSIAIVALMFAGTIWEITFISEGILGITAIVILWYTWETSQIRKAEQEIAEVNKALLLKSYHPSVGHSIFTDKKVPYDTRIRLVNISEVGAAVQLNCNLKIDGEPIKDFSPAYEGKEYWNLQIREEKEGHFSILDLYLKSGLITVEEIEIIKMAGEPNEIKKQFQKTFVFRPNTEAPSTVPPSPPEISMDLEIYCCNEKKYEAYYPPVHYKFDSFRMIWIPILTNKKPYWEFEEKPDWIKHSLR